MSERLIRVEEDEALELPPLAEQWSEGLGRKAKRGDPHSPALADSFARARAARSSVVLFIDRQIPFRVVLEILFTLGQEGVERFVLATSLPESSVKAIAGFDRRPIDLKKAGTFTVFVVSGGISVKVRGSNVATGCGGLGEGLAVPHSNDGHDFSELTRCLRALQGMPGGASGSSDDTLGFVLASARTRYDDLLRTIAALRAAGVTSFGFKVPR